MASTSITNSKTANDAKTPSVRQSRSRSPTKAEDAGEQLSGLYTNPDRERTRDGRSLSPKTSPKKSRSRSRSRSKSSEGEEEDDSEHPDACHDADPEIADKLNNALQTYISTLKEIHAHEVEIRSYTIRSKRAFKHWKGELLAFARALSHKIDETAGMLSQWLSYEIRMLNPIARKRKESSAQIEKLWRIFEDQLRESHGPDKVIPYFNHSFFSVNLFLEARHLKKGEVLLEEMEKTIAELKKRLPQSGSVSSAASASASTAIAASS